MKNKLALKEFCFVYVLSNIVHRKNKRNKYNEVVIENEKECFCEKLYVFVGAGNGLKHNRIVLFCVCFV